MPLQNNYFADYHNLKLTRDDKAVLVAEFHTNGGPFIMTAQSHTEFVDAFYRIAQDRANKIVILTGAGGEFITDVDWSSFGDVTDPASGVRFTTKAFRFWKTWPTFECRSSRLLRNLFIKFPGINKSVWTSFWH
jgi:enoyl-CoA hydratase/carnithine racemase